MIQRNDKTIKHIYKVESPKLPESYQEVEYLQNDEGAFIDTGFCPQQNIFAFELEACVLDNASVGFGVRREQASDNDNCSCMFYRGESIRNDWACMSNSYYPIQRNVYYRIAGDNSSFNINGVEWLDVNRTNSTRLAYTVYLFAINTANSVSLNTGILRIRSCRLYDNSILVRHFIPCYRKSDSVPGMFDLVNGVFYTNSGTGRFLVGADVTLKKINSIRDSFNRVIFRDSSI